MYGKVIIELKEVCKSYHDGKDNLDVLADASACFQQGELIAIQGRSGSGKSTLLNLMAGIDAADSGEISINGTSLNKLDDNRLTGLRRQHIGFVFQSFNLIPTLTVKENLSFPLALNKTPEKEMDTAIIQLLENFSIADKIAHYPDQLSGGEQQRVAIARAIVHRPLIVLADEPTGNLDLETEIQVLKLLAELPDRYGITVICATHSDDVARICHRIYELKLGKLTEIHNRNQ